MNIQTNVIADMKLAMKEKDKEKLSFNRIILSEFNRIGKNISEDQQVKIVKKLYKNAVELKNEYEQKLLEQYLPQTLNKVELTKAVDSIVDVVGKGPKNLGIVMKKLKEKYGERLDGKTTFGVVSKALNS